MSETEAIKGNVSKVKFKDGLTFNEKIITLRNMGHVIDDICIDEEWLDSSCGFVCVGDDIYEIKEKRQFDYSYMSEVELREDGSIDFMFIFYNGGTCFSEMLEEALDSGQL